jgi:hypothetical protein
MSPSAELFLKDLPEDEDSPNRALAFRSLIDKSRTCPESFDTARELYRVAASGEWHLASLHDINMVLVALELNPDLNKAVRTYVDALLSQFNHTSTSSDVRGLVADSDRGTFTMRG